VNALVRSVLGRVMAQRRSADAALDYVQALSRDTRANCWELAEAAGHVAPHRMQALLRSYQWSWDKLRAMLPELAAQCLQPDGDDDDEIGPGIASGETAHLKRGTATACAAPQHAGVTGTVTNCVTWVFAALVTRAGVDRFHRVHAGNVGEGPAAPPRGWHPGRPGVRHEAGTGD